MKTVVALFSGILFGIGLVVSGMTLPAKVIGFLDVTGNWDPALAGVMAGAIAVYGGIRWLWGSRSPVLEGAYHLPSFSAVDPRLVIGSALFGIGWGLSGFCPGPAVVAAGGGLPAALWFGGFMLVGMALGRMVESAARARSNPKVEVSPVEAPAAK